MRKKLVLAEPIVVNCENGDCSDGTNLWNYDIDYIRHIFIWASDSDLIKLSSKILNHKRNNAS